MGKFDNLKVWFGNDPSYSDILAWDFEELLELNGYAPYSGGSGGRTLGVYIYGGPGGEGKYTWAAGTQDTFNRSSGKEATVEYFFPRVLPNEFKVRIQGISHSKLVQKELFNLGFGWDGGSVREEKYTGYPWLFARRPSGAITTVETHEQGLCDPRPQFYLNQLITPCYGNKIPDSVRKQQVQEPDLPELIREGSSAIRFQSRKCKIAVGQRYTGNKTGYRPGFAKAAIGKISGAVSVTTYPGSGYGTQRPQRRAS